MNVLPRPVSQILLERGLITADQLTVIRKEQQKNQLETEHLLVSLGFVAEDVLCAVKAESSGQDSINLNHVVPDSAALALVSKEIAQYCRVLPISYKAENNILTIACADPNNLILMDRLRHVLPEPVHMHVMLSGSSEIEKAIDRHYGHSLSIDTILQEIEQPDSWKHDASYADNKDYSQPVARLVDAILIDAVKQEASDIHFEPEAAFVRIRYRIDGILRPVRVLYRAFWPAMAVRLKVMAGLNIVETRSAQDGRIYMQIGNRHIDYRISTQPVLHGENIVLRILERSKGIVPLTKLGMSDEILTLLNGILIRPEGLILVTGPTGCGKTTTLYSMLNHLNHDGVNIMTLEDPVEYPLPLARQTSIVEQGPLTFANGIRSMMRQDPDIILVGEIRDSDTANMALSAAMTGHLVFSTLHTISAIGAFPRLLDLGISPVSLNGNLIAVIAQRLVRRLCPNCKVEDKAFAAKIEQAGLSRLLGKKKIFPHENAGCDECNHRGYKGRFAIMEILKMDRNLDDSISDRASMKEIRNHLHDDNYCSLVDDGLRHVFSGETTLSELARVVNLHSDNHG